MAKKEKNRNATDRSINQNESSTPRSALIGSLLLLLLLLSNTNILLFALVPKRRKTMKLSLAPYRSMHADKFARPDWPQTSNSCCLQLNIHSARSWLSREHVNIWTHAHTKLDPSLMMPSSFFLVFGAYQHSVQKGTINHHHHPIKFWSSKILPANQPSDPMVYTHFPDWSNPKPLIQLSTRSKNFFPFPSSARVHNHLNVGHNCPGGYW